MGFSTNEIVGTSSTEHRYNSAATTRIGGFQSHRSCQQEWGIRSPSRGNLHPGTFLYPSLLEKILPSRPVSNPFCPPKKRPCFNQPTRFRPIATTEATDALPQISPIAPRISATFRNPWKVAGLKPAVLPDPRIGFLSGWAPAFLLSSWWSRTSPGPTRLDKNSLGQPTNWGRIDDTLSFWAQWFSNRHVLSVFTPLLTGGLPAESLIPFLVARRIEPTKITNTSDRAEWADEILLLLANHCAILLKL